MPPRKSTDDHHLTTAKEAEAYLARTAKRFFPAGAKVDWHVHTAAVEDVARSIVDHSADEFQPDLMIWCFGWQQRDA